MSSKGFGRYAKVRVDGQVGAEEFGLQVGGIVSVSDSHASRLGEARSAIYYLSVVILQLIPYSLAAGAGLNVGTSYFRARKEYRGEKWIGYPKEALWDFVRIFVLTVPFVIVANLWEFLSPLNV